MFKSNFRYPISTSYLSSVIRTTGPYRNHSVRVNSLHYLVSHTSSMTEVCTLKSLHSVRRTGVTQRSDHFLMSIIYSCISHLVSRTVPNSFGSCDTFGHSLIRPYSSLPMGFLHWVLNVEISNSSLNGPLPFYPFLLRM